MSSLRDVAALAGVGTGTVSRYLNKSGYVSEVSCKKIQAAIDSLNYKPNEIARNFAHNRTWIIGIMLPDIEHPFFAKFLKCAEIELYKNNYKVIVCNAAQISQRQTAFLDLLENNILDGLITGIDRWDDARFDSIMKPIVSFDRNWGNNVPLIHSDHIKTGNLIADRIIASGCRHVAHFASSGHDSEPFAMRDMIILDALKRKNIKISHVEIGWNMLDFEYSNRIVEEYMDSLSSCDAIYSGDLIALSSINIARKKGIRIPQDLKVIANDGIDITKLSYPVLTCARQNIPELARLCVQTILSLINGTASVPHEQIVDVGFQEGGSM